MRVWVRSDYAAELAVLFGWLATLLPWNLTLTRLPGIGSILFVRFPFLEVRYAWGVPLAEGLRANTVVGAWQRQAGQTLVTAYEVWLVGAALLSLTALLGVLMYAGDERDDSVAARIDERIDTVRLMGAGLLAAGAVFGVATYVLWEHSLPGTPWPVGTVLYLAFGAVLVGAERA